MDHISIECTKRDLIGNKVRKLRRQGKVPAVVYGSEITPLSIQLDLNTFVKLFRKAGKTSVIDININGEKILPVLIHDLDLDPVSDQVRHIDFMYVDLKKKTRAEVPLEFVNEPDKSAGGTLNKQLNFVEIEALPEDIPHSLEVDLSRLKKIGDSIHIFDLQLPERVSLLSEKEQLIATLIEVSEDVEPETPETIIEGESNTGEATQQATS